MWLRNFFSQERRIQFWSVTLLSLVTLLAYSRIYQPSVERIRLAREQVEQRRQSINDMRESLQALNDVRDRLQAREPELVEQAIRQELRWGRKGERMMVVDNDADTFGTASAKQDKHTSGRGY